MPQRYESGSAPLGAQEVSASEGQRPAGNGGDDRERLYQALTAGRVVSFEWDVVSDAVVRSPNAAEILGCDPARDTGSAFFGRVHEEDRERLKDLLNSMSPANPEYTTTYRYLRPTDGEEVILGVLGQGEFDASGKLVRVRGLTRDVTQSHRAERELRRGKELSEAANRLSQVLHSTLDTEQVIKRVVAEGATALGSDTAALSERKQGGWVVRSVQGMPPELVGQRLEDEQERHALLALETRDVVPVPDAFNDERFNREHFRRYNVRSVLVAPLIVRGEAFGTLFLNYHKAAHVFTEAELSFARQLAAIAASALANARLFEERKAAEAAVRENEERLRHAAELVGLEPYTWNPATGALEWGEGLRAMWGLPPGVPADFEAWWAAVHPEDRAALQAQLARSLDPNGDGAYEAEYRINAADGVQRWVSARGRTHFAQGKAVAHQGVAVDITARKWAEQALQQAHQRLRYHTQNTPLAVIEFDARLRVSAWSDGAQRMFGWQASEVLGRSMYDIPWLLAEDRPGVEKVANALSSGQTLRSVSPNRNVRKDGKVIWCEWYNSSLTDGSGQMQSIQSLVLDVTERKAAEEALRKSEARLAQAVQVGGLGFFEHNHRTEALEYSPFMRELLGFAEGEAVTMKAFLGKVLPEDRERLRKVIERAHDPAGEGLFAVEYRVGAPGGGARWLSVRSQTFFEGEGSERRPVRTIGAALDITERKEHQAELERLVAERTARLQELVGELEHFSYTITHDLKAPLRAMKGFAELASLSYGESGPGEATELLRKISASAERMDCLIADALNYSRSLRQELPLEDVDTAELLQGMLDTYPELQVSRADIRVEGKLPVVLGNRAGLTQCLSNLLGNAVKFVKPGEKPRIKLWAEEREGWARIWIEDQGIGISKAMLPRIFDMFSRGSREYEGTGIGLALVRKVTQRMGGRVGVESEEGKGSCFWLELKSGEARPQAKQAEAVPAGSQGGTVLYAEDEENDAMFMKLAFTSKGLESALRVVSDGRAAIEYLSGTGAYADRKEHPLPAVVVLDLNLPQVSGFQVLQWMRNHPDFAGTPVVVFSSSTREDDRVKAIELGANEFMGKPSSPLKFGELVEKLRERWLGVAVG